MSNWKLITPEATTNIITNPSFEDGTTGWTTGGTNTITQSATEQRRGVYGLKCAYSNNAILASYALTLTAASHAVGIDIYIPTAYTGTAVSLNLVGYTSMTGTITANADMTELDQWQRVELVAIPNAGDLVGTLEVKEAGTPGGAEFIYIDGVQVETGTYATTYTDITRDALDATGGKVNDLSDDLSFTIGGQDGTGMPPVSNLSSPLALQPGSIFEDQTIDARQFTLTGSIVGSTLEDFHAKRQGLIAALNPKTVKINKRAQARTFRYTGSAVDKQISAVYDGGMELGLKQNDGFGMMDIPLRLKADDPMFYEVGNSGFVLATNDTTSVSYFLSRDNLGGVDAYGNVGTGTVYAILETDGFIFIGGSFVDWGSTSGDFVKMWNKTSAAWESLTTATAATGTAVYDFVEFADGTIVLGGDFVNIGGGAGVNFIRTFDGTTLGGYTNELSAAVRGLSLDSSGTLFAAGDFTTYSGGAAGAANRAAMLVGTSWTGLGTGLDARSRTVATFGDYVYFGGDFANAGGSPAANVARWNTNSLAWEPMGSGPGGNVYTMVAEENGTIYAGGDFTGNVKFWNGTAWSNTGSGLNGLVYKLYLSSDGLLYAVGDFTSADGKDAPGMAVWNGSVWAGVNLRFPSATSVKTVMVSDEVYVGFDTAGTATSAGQNTITYSGTEAAAPMIVISRTGGTSAKIVNIANEITGAVLSFNYDLQDGETITIDTRPGSQSITSTASGLILNSISTGSAFGNFFLMPGNVIPYDNIITAFIDEVGSPTVTTTMTYRTTYMSED